MPEIHIFSGQQVMLPGKDTPVAASIEVDLDTGKILAIHEGMHHRSEFTQVDDNHWTDAGADVIIPGLVDAHVHLNEPGRTDWEGFRTGTRAAISGGVTTVVDMPLNSIPPTTTVENLEEKKKAAKGQCWSNVAFWGGCIPNNEFDLLPLVDAGVKGFKCFMIESGVPEFPCVSENDLRKAMTELQKNESTVLAFHAELDTPTEANTLDPTLYSTFLGSRPQKMETDAITLVTTLQKDFPQLRCHIVHLSAASALPIIRKAKADGLRLTVETCFHYLCLWAGDIQDRDELPKYKCCPPIREEGNREELWNALKDGTIDFVVSDHSPCVKMLKEKDIMSAWGGISTLGLGLSLLWTEGSKRGISLGMILKWTCDATAKHAGLHSKGGLRAGADADIVFWNPNAELKVDQDLVEFKNKLTPYHGKTLRGQVSKTFLGGKVAYDRSQGFTGLKPLGRLL